MHKYYKKNVSALICLMMLSIALWCSASMAQTAPTCPSGFTTLSEDSTTLVCRFQQMLATTPPPGTLPEDTSEGFSLITGAQSTCKAAGGTRLSFGSLGTDTVFLDCGFDKPTSSTPPTTTPTPGGPAPPLTPTTTGFDFDDDVEDDIAEVMVLICNSLLGSANQTLAESDFLNRCRDIQNESDQSLKVRAIDRIAAKQYADTTILIGFQSMIQIGDIGNRLSTLRSVMSQNTRDVAQTGPLQHPAPGLLARSPMIGGAAGDDDNGLNRFGAFITASGGEGDKQRSSLSTGFDYSSRSVTLGLDYLLNDSTVLGAALGYGDSESTLFAEIGTIDIRTDNLSLYAAKHLGNGWFIDAVAGLGKIDTKNQRNIRFLASDTAINVQSRSQFDADQSILSLGFAKSFDKKFDIDFSARFNYIRTDIDRFAESTDNTQTGFSLAFEVDNYQLDSLTADLTASISKAYSLRWGVLIPKLTLRYIHDFEELDEPLQGRFLADVSSFDFQQSNLNLGGEVGGSTIFNIPLTSGDTDYTSLRVGATILLPNQFSSNFSVVGTYGISDFDHLYYSWTLRRDF